MRAIVTVGFGSPTYTEGVKRLKRSVAERVDPVPVIDSFPVGCPGQREVPFAFKPNALLQAWQAGYETLLWLDSCSVVTGDLSPVWDAIERAGYYLIQEGWTSGEWCSDAALEPLGLTREESFGIWHLYAGCIGLDLRHSIARAFLKTWADFAYPGGPFCGPWHDGTEVSEDPRVLGHRHDQTVASVVAWKLGMAPTLMDRSLYAYEKPRDGAPLLALSPWEALP